MPPPDDVNAAQAAAAGNVIADNVLNRPVAIPKFDGLGSHHAKALIWMDGVHLYWGHELDTLSQQQLEGFLAFALTAEALVWYQEEHSTYPAITATWADFIKLFKATWIDSDLPRSAVAATIKTLFMEQQEPLRKFRTRCLACARHATKLFTAADGETEDQKKTRIANNTSAVENQAMWYIWAGVLPIIRAELIKTRNVSTLDETMAECKVIVAQLIDQGKYRDPSAAQPLIPKAVPQQAVQAINTHIHPAPIVSLQQQYDALDPAAAQSFLAKITARQGQSKSKPKSNRNSSSKAPASKGRERKFDASKYTEGAKCTFCHTMHHTEAQCMAKQNNQAAGMAAALHCTAPSDQSRFASTTDFWQ